MQFEECALKLNASDFACQSKANAKPHGRELANSSTRTMPIGKRTWTAPKKVMYLLRHSQHAYREEDGTVEFWRIKEKSSEIFAVLPSLV